MWSVVYIGVYIIIVLIVSSNAVHKLIKCKYALLNDETMRKNMSGKCSAEIQRNKQDKSWSWQRRIKRFPIQYTPR